LLSLRRYLKILVSAVVEEAISVVAGDSIITAAAVIEVLVDTFIVKLSGIGVSARSRKPLPVLVILNRNW
jgi:hypothetical protein